MEHSIGFKDLYSVSLKTTYPIEVNGEFFEVGETIAIFDKIQIANFQEIKTTAQSRGGYQNQGLIWWEETQEIRLNFSQGVFSKTQLALMTNAQIVKNEGEQIFLIDQREELESNEFGKFFLKHLPKETIFVYDKITGKKIKEWTLKDNVIDIHIPFQEVVVDYKYEYNNGCTILQLGQPFAHGTFSLTGKVKAKDETTGQVVTGIINIPKLRLMSDLSMRIGSEAVPQVGRFDATAIPTGARGERKVMEIIFLNDDIDADM